MNEDELTRMDVIALALAAYEIAKNNEHIPHVEAHWLDLFDKWVRMFNISTDELNNFRWPDPRKRYDTRIFNLQITKEQ
jgi:hypothetical protein